MLYNSKDVKVVAPDYAQFKYSKIQVSNLLEFRGQKIYAN